MDWQIIKENFKNEIWYSVSDGKVGERTFSYDYRTKKEAETKLKKLKSA